ncbi:MAG: phycobilisome polypeptide [Synechococcus sp.]|nr:phycobilisome polypeptide [Synechococcus sp.]
MSHPSPDEIATLARKAHVFGLHRDKTIPGPVRQLLQQANEAKRLLSEAEINQLCSTSGVNATALNALQQQAEQLVDATRQELLQHQPQLVEPGGALHPAHRAEACWRDCFHFLRVCLYGVAVGRPQVCDPDGMEALGELYHAVGVPIDALLLALAGLRSRAGAAFGALTNSQDVALLDQALDELEQRIGGFVVTSC